jgi:hypothetical protein
MALSKRVLIPRTDVAAPQILTPQHLNNRGSYGPAFAAL